MVYIKAVLAFALVASVSAATTVSVSTSNGASTVTTATATTVRPFFFQNALNSLGSSARAMIGLVNSTAHTGTKMLNDGVLGFTGAGQQVVNTVSGLGSTGLRGGVDAVKQGIDIGTNMAAVLPVTGRLASVGGNWAKTGADVGNMGGQTAISVGSGIENGKLQLLGGLTSAGTGMANKGINMGVGMATAGLDTGLRMANGALGTVGNVMDTAVSYSNKVSDKVSSMANSIADKVSVSSSSLSPSIFVPGLMDNIPVSSGVNGVAVSGSGSVTPTQVDSKVQVKVAA